MIYHFPQKEQLLTPERYCNQVHLAEKAEEENSIYLTLLSLYLSPPHGYEPQNDPAIDLLAKHGSRLPADAALKLIPDKQAVQKLEFYFKGRMRAANSVFNEARIVANLRKARDMQIQAQLALGEGIRGGGTRGGVWGGGARGPATSLSLRSEFVESAINV